MNWGKEKTSMSHLSNFMNGGTRNPPPKEKKGFPFLTANLGISYTNWCCYNLFQLGINFPKALYLTLDKEFSISQEGIFYHLNKKCNAKYLLFMILARFIAILQTIFYLFSVPFMILFYTLVFAFTILPTILLWPFYLCLQNLKFKGFYLLCLTFSWGSFMSLVTMTAHILILPLQIIIPELTALIFKVHRWGDPIEDYLDEEDQ